MSKHGTFCLLTVAVMLALTVLACNGTNPTVTPATPLPTLAPPADTPNPVSSSLSNALTPAQTPTLFVAGAPTDTPIPPVSLTPTPVIPRACPPPGDPASPDQPASFDDYPTALGAYLSQGGSAQKMERLLHDWGAITDETGGLWSLDLTGDIEHEIVVALNDPMPEVDLPWPPGDVVIFQCQGGAVVPVYSGRLAIGEGSADSEESDKPQFTLERIEDVNGTGRADVVFVTSTCGAHTCSDRLYVIEWDGAGFVDRVPDMTDYPYATFNIDNGQILVDVGGIGSAGAGLQRSYQEAWVWDGKQFALTEQTVGPPTALVHYIHDGDGALAQGDYGAAIDHYERALEDNSLPSGLFLETEEQGVAVLKAYARFKLNVAYAASGDYRAAQSHYDLLVAEHPQGTPGFPYVFLAQVYGTEFLTNYEPDSACGAVTAIAEGDLAFAERLYAGYANPEYEAGDLCRVE